MRFTRKSAALGAVAVALCSQGAMAQDNDADALMAMDKDTLRSEIQTRFDAALALSNDPAIQSADNVRYVWANEAKAQCGIALGYLKSSTKDPVSIGKCARAYELMNYVPAAPPPPPPPEAVPQEICENPAIIFFDFDVRTPPAEAAQVIDFVSTNYQRCDWNALEVVGHADRSGSDAYNMGLSQDRAENVAAMLRMENLPGVDISVDYKGESSPRVPTEDGVRELQNRRVEILVR